MKIILNSCFHVRPRFQTEEPGKNGKGMMKETLLSRIGLTPRLHGSIF